MERLFSKAMAAIRISEKGMVLPFLRRADESSPALIQRSSDISMYSRDFKASMTAFFSLSDFKPCESSYKTGPQTKIASFKRRRSRVCFNGDAPGLKYSIHAQVSGSTPLFFMELFPFLLGLKFGLFFLLPIVVYFYLPL